MQIAPGRKPIFYSRFLTRLQVLSIRFGCGTQGGVAQAEGNRTVRPVQLCRIMLQCILVAVSHSFFGPKSNRGLIALISLHISRIVLPPGHALPSPSYPNCLACLSALLVPGTKRSKTPHTALLPRLAQLVHADDIIVCLTIYTNYPPNVWRLHQCNNPQDEPLNNLNPSSVH